MSEERGAVLRAARASDVDGIRACVRGAYAMYVPRMGKEPGPMLADFEAQVAAGQVTVLEAEGRLRGLIVMFPGADHLFVENVAVWPDAQGRGYGRRLLRYAESEARRLGLDEIRLYTEERMTENLTPVPGRRVRGDRAPGRGGLPAGVLPQAGGMSCFQSSLRAGTGGMRSLNRPGRCPRRCS